jgi:hypothetical protein
MFRALLPPLLVVSVGFFSRTARAGGPEYVAGAGFFDSNVIGQPLVWPQGVVTYYTDQGDLSPILPGPSADALVADAFSEWTRISTAAVIATRAGQLAEDVNGSNVTGNPNGTYNLPADIEPAATGTPVGIVYDSDGSVTDAILGAGAGSAALCFSDAAFGGVDNFGTEANFLHALVVINGQCAQQSSQLTDVEYRLVRVLGNVLGLGWSQLNLNVITGNPTPTTGDLAGFPVMHYLDPISCVPITACYPNPYAPKADDIAALSRLYPVTAQNQSNFPGKQVLAATTARIHGAVWFTDPSGRAAQAMQGVNVVARWVNPATGQPSRSVAASSVSGFLFAGNAGNPITGFNDALGNPFDKWGSGDFSVRGFFDLAGLTIPAGATTAEYQLTVEGLDPVWSEKVGPYGHWQVAPSGSAQPILVTVNLGGDFEQDVLMQASAQPAPQWAATESFTSPAPVPVAGDWIGSLSAYGEVDYFWLAAQANRTMSVAVTALNEVGAASESKVQPVIGMWALIDPQGTAPPALTLSPFNAATFAESRLDAQLLLPTSFRIGIADVRGDGRADYHYHAHVLYADSATPSRIGVNGGAVRLQGIGFSPSLIASIGGVNVPVLAAGAGQMVLSIPPKSDGAQTLIISDPLSGAFSTMTNALTQGAASTDEILLLQGSNPVTPAGTQAANPVRVQVVAADGRTPVSGATVGWSATGGATLSACGGANARSAFTDESGAASTWVTAGSSAVATITATLAPGAYASSPSVAATLVTSSSGMSVSATPAFFFASQGATLNVPLTARVVNNGSPQNGAAVDFTLLQGAGALGSSTVITNSAGNAANTLALSQFTGIVQMTACLGPANVPCQSFKGISVPPSSQNLQPVAGTAQIVTLGQPFLPLTVRVTDSSTPPNPVMGATVNFQSTIVRTNAAGGSGGESSPGEPSMPVILSNSQSTAQTDANGLASVTPSVGSLTGPLEMEIVIAAGSGALLQYNLEALPAESTGSSSGSSAASTTSSPSIPASVARPLDWLKDTTSFLRSRSLECGPQLVESWWK